MGPGYIVEWKGFTEALLAHKSNHCRPLETPSALGLGLLQALSPTFLSPLLTIYESHPYVTRR